MRDPQGGMPQRNGRSLPSQEAQSQLQVEGRSPDTVPGEMSRRGSAPAVSKPGDRRSGSSISGQMLHAQHRMLQNDGTDGTIAPESVAQTNGVPPLQLEDLVSSRGSDRREDGAQSSRDIPGMIKGFPLLTVPKERLAWGRERDDPSARSEYDMIPTRDGDGARGGIPPKQDIVLLRAAPDNVGESPPRRSAPVPPAYKQTFTFGMQSQHGPPVYPTSGAQPTTMGGIPLLRVPPERDHNPMLIQHPPQYPVTTHDQMNRPTPRHYTGQKPAHLNVNGQYAPPRPVPFEAWGMPSGGGTNQPFPPQGRIDIPLLRINQSNHPPAVLQPMHPTYPNTQVLGKSASAS